MTYSTAKRLLSVDIDLLSLEELQKYKVKIIDALREANAEYGYSQACKNGFFIPIASESASGYTPKDKFLSENLNQIYQKVYTLEQTFYT